MFTRKSPQFILTCALFFLVSMGLAGSASAVFSYCHQPGSCESNPNAKCTSNGAGWCPTFCYMTCAEYAQCSGANVSSTSAATDSVELSVELLGADNQTWLETLAGGYGPCLVMPISESTDSESTPNTLLTTDEPEAALENVER